MAWAIYISFAGALISALLPEARPVFARWWALLVAAAGLAIAVAGFAAGVGQGRQVFVDCSGCPPWAFTFFSQRTASAACSFC